jgi:hypothetical protein
MQPFENPCFKILIMLLSIITSLNSACQEAQIDANKDVSKLGWFVTGCAFLFPIGWPILPNVAETKPPADRIIGKPAEYVLEYTKCYKETAKRIQNELALTGCAVGTISWITLAFIVAGALSTEPSFSFPGIDCSSGGSSGGGCSSGGSSGGDCSSGGSSGGGCSSGGSSGSGCSSSGYSNSSSYIKFSSWNK